LCLQEILFYSYGLQMSAISSKAQIKTNESCRRRNEGRAKCEGFPVPGGIGTGAGILPFWPANGSH